MFVIGVVVVNVALGLISSLFFALSPALCIRSNDDIRSAKLAYSNAEFRCDAFFVHRPTYVEPVSCDSEPVSCVPTRILNIGE